MPWFLSNEDCNAPSYERYLWDYDWGGKKRGLTLCFLALDNGTIPYAVAPTPPEEERRKEAEDLARKARGEPPPLERLVQSPWFYGASEYDARVQGYVNKGVAELKITPDVRDRLNKAQSRASWRARKKAFGEAAPWVSGICVFIWLFTAVMGWIVRGFAGVPRGQDFKPEAKN